MRDSSLKAGLLVRALGVAVALHAGGSVAEAGISAGFSGGAGTTQPDQYPGTAGSGWDSDWKSILKTSGSDVTDWASAPTVSSASPLNGGGNYLTALAQARAGMTGSAYRATIARDYDGAGGAAADPAGVVMANSPHRVSFDLRLDSLSGFTSGAVNNGNGDYIQIFDRPSLTQLDPGSDATWMLRAFGGNSTNSTGGAAGPPGMRWSWYNGARDSGAFNVGLYQDSGLALVVGRTYHFDVTLDPASRSYTVSIDDLNDAAGPVSSGVLGFRSSATSVSTVIYWGVAMSAANDQVGFSLDSVQIVAVPEPAGMGLMALGMAGLLRRRR